MKTAHQNVPAPQQSQDVVNKGYVDSVAGVQLRNQGPTTGPSNSALITQIVLQNLRAYTFKVTVIVSGSIAGPVYKTRTYELQFNVRCVAGVATLIASGTSEEFGDVATWTIVPSVLGNQLSLTFNTGADTHTCYVSTNLETVDTTFV